MQMILKALSVHLELYDTAEEEKRLFLILSLKTCF